MDNLQMEDTEWTDALKKFGIIKDEPKREEEIEEVVEEKEIKFANQDEEDAWLDENEDEDFIAEYRAKRMMELKAQSLKPCFGEVAEITGVDYVQQVNKAGDGIWVVLLLYRPGHPMSTLMQNLMTELAVKFKETKFLKSISTLCVANFPDSNLPAIFVYHNGQMIKQLIGPRIFGTEKITLDEVEWILATTGAVQTTLEQDPRRVESRKFFKQYDSDSD